MVVSHRRDVHVGRNLRDWARRFIASGYVPTLPAWSVADPKTLQLIFATAYGRLPTADEMPRVKAAGAAAIGASDFLRRIIALFELERYRNTDQRSVWAEGFDQGRTRRFSDDASGQ